MGSYLVSGEATSLNGATITVAAVRTLTPSAVKQTSSYSLLDRQLTSVSNGEWQVKLQIWQSNQSAIPQEMWQLDQAAFDMALTPNPEVTFTATLDPVEAEDWPGVITRHEAHAPGTVRQTDDGERYLVARNDVVIPVPNATTADGLEATAARRIRDRKITTVKPTLSTTDAQGRSAAANRTSVPLSSEEYLQ